MKNLVLEMGDQEFLTHLVFGNTRVNDAERP
jgi:hypothetical protein